MLEIQNGSHHRNGKKHRREQDIDLAFDLGLAHKQSRSNELQTS
jgi:hypothetical protein